MNSSDRVNKRRLIRKIELLESNTQQQEIDLNQLVLNKKLQLEELSIDMIGLKYEKKDDLKLAIQQRVEKRIKFGAFEEVECLIKSGWSKNDPGFQTLGYKQIFEYFEKSMTKEGTIRQWMTKELQYAKRQNTFMNRDPNIQWHICS